MSKPLTKYTFDENGNYRRKDRFYMPDVDGDTFYKASDVDDRLRQRVEQVVQYSQEAADLKAQLREESQFSLERQGIIDGLRSERSRHTEVVDKLRSSLAAMTAERDEWQVKARYKHTHDESLECELQQQLAASQARCAELEGAFSLYCQSYVDVRNYYCSNLCRGSHHHQPCSDLYKLQAALTTERPPT